MPFVAGRLDHVMGIEVGWDLIGASKKEASSSVFLHYMELKVLIQKFMFS